MNTPRQIVYPLFSNEVVLYEDEQYYHDLLGGCPNTNLFAVTFTLLPAEWQVIKDMSHINQIDYISFVLNKFYKDYVFITELTKKKVLHLHGIVAEHTDLPEEYRVLSNSKKYYDKKNKEVRFRDNRYPNQNVIKKLHSTRQITGWFNYMKKEMTPYSILEFFYHNNE